LYYSEIFYNKGLGIKTIFTIIITIFIFFGCANRQPKLVSSATILIKTPTMKFYDKGFISKYSDHINVQIFSAGSAILNLDIFDDRVCKDTFSCETNSSFNKKYLDKSYKNTFLKELFSENKKQIIHRDKKNNILIKILKD
jgi:hypothetical protein